MSVIDLKTLATIILQLNPLFNKLEIAPKDREKACFFFSSTMVRVQVGEINMGEEFVLYFDSHGVFQRMAQIKWYGHSHIEEYPITLQV